MVISNRGGAMNISPEIINLVNEVRNDKTHSASQLANSRLVGAAYRSVI